MTWTFEKDVPTLRKDKSGWFFLLCLASVSVLDDWRRLGTPHPRSSTQPGARTEQAGLGSLSLAMKREIKRRGQAGE